MKSIYLRIFLISLLFIWYAILLSNKIDLTTADLGRYLKNGEFISKEILTTNFYSYTNTDYPFLNHHWATGSIFYFIFKISGFVGLSLFFILTLGITLILFFNIAQKMTDFRLVFVLSLFLLPLMADRKEIRPEIFTYLISSLFFFLLWHFRYGKISFRTMLILPILEIVWINTHIYFFLGPALICVFLLSSLIEKQSWEKIKKLIILLILTILATIMNPFGIRNTLYPFFIVNNSGYRVLEEQSVFFLDRLNVVNPNFILFKAVFLVLLVSFILVYLIDKKKFSFLFFGLGFIFSAMAILRVRNIALFALFSLPILAYNTNVVITKIKLEFIRRHIILIATISFFLLFIIYNHFLSFQLNKKGVGLVSGNEAAAYFFISNNLRGPIMNNYDIGGYLIYYLFPMERVFVDNRPEAYPASFFSDIYIPLQEDESFWQAKSNEYNFNVIFFNYRDATPWGQKFLIKRVSDTKWAPVYTDSSTIIFLKRTPANEPVIKKNEIPKEKFRIEEVK